MFYVVDMVEMVIRVIFQIVLFSQMLSVGELRRQLVLLRASSTSLTSLQPPILINGNTGVSETAVSKNRIF